MGYYKKKPVVIQATRWYKNGDHPYDFCEWIKPAGGPAQQNSEPFLSEGRVVRYFRHPGVSGDKRCNHCNKLMHYHGWIDTLEGGHTVCPGDWIITGVNGERYPCKPDIFEKTYDELKVAD